MNPDPFEDEEDERSFFQRNRVLIIIGGLMMTGGILMVAKKLTNHSGPTAKAPEVRQVTIQPPPATPPPPPPPPPPEMKEEKMIEETNPVDTPPDEPSNDPPAVTSSGPAGNDAFGLKGGKGGLGTIGGNRGQRSKYGSYAGGIVQPKIAEALRQHSKTRNAALKVEARIWVDSTGRVTRATIAGSTGDAQTDAAICKEILTGLQLSQPPPQGMPMPIVMRLSGKRPTS